MRFTKDDIKYIKEHATKEDAIRVLKIFANTPDFELFITKGAGKALIQAFDLDDNLIKTLSERSSQGE